MKFWGVRGSLPGCNKDQQQIGGHTSCVSITSGQDIWIFDAGTGLVNLGKWLLETSFRRVHIFISHAHFDHILGLPFFKPMWDGTFDIHLYCGPICGVKNLQELLVDRIFKPPFFPVYFKDLRANIHLHDLTEGQEIPLERAHLKTLPLNHPGSALGYRLEHQGKVFCYLTDMEHKGDTPQKDLVDFSHGADLAVYDATFTDDEYERHIGWGHSTWQQGIKLAKAAQIKSLAFYHHAYFHSDDQMLAIEKEAQSQWPGAFVARQNFERAL